MGLDPFDGLLQKVGADGPELTFDGNALALEAWRRGRTGYPIVDAGMRIKHAVADALELVHPTGEPDLHQGRGTPGRSQLYVDGELVASTDLPYTVPNLFSIIGLSCGRDGIDSVSPDDYPAPNPSRATIHSVTLDVSGDVIVDSDSELHRLMSQQ